MNLYYLHLYLINSKLAILNFSIEKRIYPENFIN
jgi:hypothetical protein